MSQEFAHPPEPQGQKISQSGLLYFIIQNYFSVKEGKLLPMEGEPSSITKEIKYPWFRT
jgi:hypothetical protein